MKTFEEEKVLSDSFLHDFSHTLILSTRKKREQYKKIEKIKARLFTLKSTAKINLIFFLLKI